YVIPTRPKAEEESFRSKRNQLGLQCPKGFLTHSLCSGFGMTDQKRASIAGDSLILHPFLHPCISYSIVSRNLRAMAPISSLVEMPCQGSPGRTRLTTTILAPLKM